MHLERQDVCLSASSLLFSGRPCNLLHPLLLPRFLPLHRCQTWEFGQVFAVESKPSNGRHWHVLSGQALVRIDFGSHRGAEMMAARLTSGDAAKSDSAAGDDQTQIACIAVVHAQERHALLALAVRVPRCATVRR
jgi:hypothetical protein